MPGAALNLTKAPFLRIRIFLNPQLFLSGYGFRPHVSGESGWRIRNFLIPLSRVRWDFLNTLRIQNPVDIF